MEKKKILIVGTGSIAERHLKNIISINPSLNISILSGNYIRAQKFSKKFKKKNIKPIFLKELAKENFSHVIIANKTKFRNKFLHEFIKEKCNIYCEKPLPIDNNFNSLQKFSKVGKINDKVKIGFQFRFNPAIQYLKKKIKQKSNKDLYFIQLNCGQNLKDWRKNSNYKDFNAGGNSLYSSVCWELCHELDILQYLLERPNKVFSSIKNTKLLKTSAKDISLSIFKFKNRNIDCSINIEMLSPKIYRKLIVASLNNYYEIDLVKNNVLIRTKNKVKKLKFNSTRNDMFKSFMRRFISDKKKSKVFDYATLEDGIFVSKIIKKMYLSNKLNKLINI